MSKIKIKESIYSEDKNIGDIVAFENGVIRVVSSKLDNVLSVLNSKVYNK